jgi:DNA polymerase III alpha subunit
VKIRYDLHIHSCLSPCGSDESTPANIAGFAALAGIDIAALTDHNNTANCAAFERAAKHYGIIPLSGLELTTSEDIHVLCLFDSAKKAEEFGELVYASLPKIKNKPEIFGRQIVTDENDNIIKEEEFLLINGTSIGFYDAAKLAYEYGGVALPAHIDKQSNGAIAILGTLPHDAGFSAFEVSRDDKIEYCKAFTPLNAPVIINSDAHTLNAIGTRGGVIELDCEREDVAKAMIRYLRGG